MGWLPIKRAWLTKADFRLHLICKYLLTSLPNVPWCFAERKKLVVLVQQQQCSCSR